jgi:hypothetical protein
MGWKRLLFGRSTTLGRVACVSVVRNTFHGGRRTKARKPTIPYLVLTSSIFISNVNGREPFIGTAVVAARELGWPTSIEGTEQVPQTPPVAWNYSDKIDVEFGGPGPVLGTKASAVINLEKDQVFELVLQNTRALNGAAYVYFCFCSIVVVSVIRLLCC